MFVIIWVISGTYPDPGTRHQGGSDKSQVLEVSHGVHGAMRWIVTRHWLNYSFVYKYVAT